MRSAALLLACVLQACPSWAVAQAMTGVTTVPPEVQQALPQAQRIGSGRLTVWGFQAYDASLWAAPGFRADNYGDHTFVLELGYLRDFSGESIAERSILEMRRIGSFSDAQATEWTRSMRAAFPDVRRGDRISGIHQPGGKVRFVTNGRATGEIHDETFARLFFGIWLAPQTSEPALRRALLGQAQP
ncbi:chalcone isomerase family protein [Variovorax sp. VNK109]|uniref:chalcone isomerase family protein n=1 Tax=Variovorax sp. VNK109 TaxID=3400919 RepID=UPI003C1018A5